MKARKNKDILNSSFTLPILSKLYSGYRPAQIAGQLGITPQAIKYHTDNMIDARLIRKVKGERIQWVVEEKGLFILRQKITGSVNSFTKYQTKPVTRVIPTRLDNLSFKFKIQSPIPPDDHLHWSEMKHGVSKCSLRYDNHTVELIRSEKDGSILIIHLGSKYCFDWPTQLIEAYELSRHYAKQTATQYRLDISEYGSLNKRPHFAFEQDLIAFFTAASNTASISIGIGRQDLDKKAWTDSSNGTGELETDDPDYAFLYLMMPRTVEEIANMTAITAKRIIGYEKCYLPSLTINN